MKELLKLTSYKVKGYDIFLILHKISTQNTNFALKKICEESECIKTEVNVKNFSKGIQDLHIVATKIIDKNNITILDELKNLYINSKVS